MGRLVGVVDPTGDGEVAILFGGAMVEGGRLRLSVVLIAVMLR